MPTRRESIVDGAASSFADVRERVLDKGVVIRSWLTGPPSSKRRASRAVASMTADRGLCLYAIAHGREWERITLPETRSGATPTLITHGGIGLVAADVDLAQYRDLRTAPMDDDTLAALVREHDEVVRAVFDHEPVLPLRFGTIVADADAARRLLTDRHDEVTDWLGRVEGHREWALRVEYEDPAGAPTLTGLSGANYLRNRRQRAGLVQSLHVELSKLVTSSINHDGPETLLDAAYLVRQENEDKFRSTAAWLCEEVRQLEATVHATGPWPPYSFTRIELAIWS